VVAPQALLFLNSPHVRACADGFAGRLKWADGPTAVDRAYRLAFARPPSQAESDAGVEFLKDRTPAEYALVLMSLNEFIYID
jgi:hypothetical protein